MRDCPFWPQAAGATLRVGVSLGPHRPTFAPCLHYQYGALPPAWRGCSRSHAAALRARLPPSMQCGRCSSRSCRTTHSKPAPDAAAVWRGWWRWRCRTYVGCASARRRRMDRPALWRSSAACCALRRHQRRPPPAPRRRRAAGFRRCHLRRNAGRCPRRRPLRSRPPRCRGGAGRAARPRAGAFPPSLHCNCDTSGSGLERQPRGAVRAD